MSRITVFDYPTSPHARRHGPMGYADYGSFRDWLRDEFCFRCVFCLQREQWGRLLAAFHVDHFVPRCISPERALDYENLLYVCASCNSTKSDLDVPNPCEVSFGECLSVLPNGEIRPLNAVGEGLIALLALDAPDATRFRKLILDTLQTLQKMDAPTYRQWVQFPEDLPDLSRRKAPQGNQRPNGISETWFAKKQRGELPDTY